MRKLITALCAGAMALSMAVQAGAQGAEGMGGTNRTPQYAPGFHGGDDGLRLVRDHRRAYRTHHRRSDRRRGFYRHGGYGWYNGHRGYRHYRHGYREYNGWWFPTAILGGAIIGNAIVNAPRTGSAHVEWCYNRYRSYRASDNTFQPYNGPRRQCRSPY